MTCRGVIHTLSQYCVYPTLLQDAGPSELCTTMSKYRVCGGGGRHTEGVGVDMGSSYHNS